MNVETESKPKGSLDQSNEGNYTEEQLSAMLEAFLLAKEIESDPQKLAMLKDYAKSKQKHVEKLFDVNNVPPVKSMDDLKKRYKDKVDEDGPTNDEYLG